MKFLLSVLLLLYFIGAPIQYQNSAYAGPVCTVSQKESAKQVIVMLQTFAKRTEYVNEAIYDWDDTWFSLPYSNQMGMIKSAADAEACLSDGQKTIIRFKCNGETVAKADGKIEVLKSTR